jgi:hypothetical protein
MRPLSILAADLGRGLRHIIPFLRSPEATMINPDDDRDDHYENEMCSRFFGRGIRIRISAPAPSVLRKTVISRWMASLVTDTT